MKDFDEALKSLLARIEALEEDNKYLKQKVMEHEAQFDHHLPRIDDIEDKIDWSKEGKI